MFDYNPQMFMHTSAYPFSLFSSGIPVNLLRRNFVFYYILLLLKTLLKSFLIVSKVVDQAIRSKTTVYLLSTILERFIFFLYCLSYQMKRLRVYLRFNEMGQSLNLSAQHSVSLHLLLLI